MENQNPTASVDSSLISKVVISLFICILGMFGNAVVIFVITVLKEYVKSITHWYVLQLAIADSLFLLTLPFKVSQNINDAWIYPEWLCKAKETILFLNYYASILFLTVMSIDRYIAVCQTFSPIAQKLRKRNSVYLITVSVWAVALLLCIPVMMYSVTSGIEPNCKCTYEFPTYKSGNSALSECLNVEGSDNAYAKLVCEQLLKSKKSQSFCSKIETIPPPSNTTWELSGNGEEQEVFDGGYLTLPHNEVSDGGYLTLPHNDSGDDASGSGNLNITSYLNGECTHTADSAFLIAFLYFNFIGMFMLPLAVMVVCYGLIIRRLAITRFSTSVPKSTSFTTAPTNGSKHSYRKKSNSRSDKDRKRITIMCAALVSSFVFCWLPYHALHLAKIIGIRNTEAIVCINIFEIGILVGYLNSALNPYLYTFLGTQFKRRWSAASTSLHSSIRRRRTSSSGSFGGSTHCKVKRTANVKTASDSKPPFTNITRTRIETSKQSDRDNQATAKLKTQSNSHSSASNNISKHSSSDDVIASEYSK